MRMDGKGRMNRDEIVDQMHARVPGMTKKDAAAALEAAFESLTSAFVMGRDVEVRGVGTFKIISKSARMITLPSGERRKLPPSRTVKFRPSSRILSTMNRPADV